MAVTDGIMSAVIGALTGAGINRQRKRQREKEDRLERIAEEDRQREIQNDRRRMEMEEALAKLRLFSTPGVRPAAATPAAAPQPEPQLPPGMDPMDPAGPSAFDAPPPPPAPAAPTGAQRIKTPFGEVDFTPPPSDREVEEKKEKDERTRLEAGRKSAWEELKRLHPTRYRTFVPEFDYNAELADVLGDQRTGDRQAADDARRRREVADERAREQKINRARTRAANMLRSGAPVEQVVAALDTYPDIRGAIGNDEVVEIAKQINSTKGDPRTAERRQAFEKKLGSPTTQLEQDILDALADGDTKQDIITQLTNARATASTIASAERYMRALR
jgi:hypothetical protein